jgi:hypothetical protein
MTMKEKRGRVESLLFVFGGSYFSYFFLFFASFLYTSCMLWGAYAFYKNSDYL